MLDDKERKNWLQPDAAFIPLAFRNQLVIKEISNYALAFKETDIGFYNPIVVYNHVKNHETGLILTY